MTTDSRRAPDAPAHAGSPDGKTAPMSGCAAAPRSASHSVGDHVAVGVADEALVVRDVDRPQHQRPAGAEAVGVGARADPHRHLIGTWVACRREKRVMVS